MTSSSPTYKYNQSGSLVKDKKNFGVSGKSKGTDTDAQNTSTSTPLTDPTTAQEFPPVENTDTAISVDSASGTITLINSESETSGAIWYAGSSSSSNVCNPCADGVCPFGIGFRAYFEFKTLADTSTRSDAVMSNGVLGPGGDGFAFAVMNAGNNTISDRGGIPSNGFSMGSLLGYAGPGNTTDKLGLQPPKFAVEFDLYPSNTRNVCYNSTYCVACPNGESGYCDICSSGRYDNAGSYDTSGSGGNTSNHIALMLWGKNPASTFMCYSGSNAGSSYPQASMDDTYHGAGDGSTSNPYNSSLSGYGSGLGGYYERSRSANGGTYNWMEDTGWHRVRLEVLRNPTAYTYQIKVWVDCEINNSPFTACTAGEYVYFQDIYTPYSNASYPPKINRTVTLSETYSNMLNNILFGFTEGSGTVTQTISITNFSIYFPTISIAPANASHTYSAGTGTVSVTTALSSCQWKAHSNKSWITVTDDNVKKTGSGTVNYSITQNTTSALRTGTISIGDQSFTITQTPGPPSCTLTAGQNIVPYNGTAALTWNVSGSAATASWTSSPGGTCGSPNPAGGSCTTAVQTNAGERTFTLNVSNTSGSSTCQASFKVLPNRYYVRNSRSSSFYVRGGNYGSCSRIRSGNDFQVRYNDASVVNIYTNNSCSTAAALSSVSYMSAGNIDADGDGNVSVNSSWQLVDR